MSDVSPILSLPLLQASQAQKHVTHNEALRLLDVLVQPAVASRSLTVPPDPASAGERQIVAPGGVGAWAGHDGRIAYYQDDQWQFLVPQPGWQAHVVDEAASVAYDGGDWRAPGEVAQRTVGLGINTASDGVNRLAVSSEATLLTHDGAGHQLKLNKNAAGDTVSLLFQSGWTGHAEMGLAGSDDFAIKVSADGATWATALTFAAATGLASGAAVQASPTDVTTGRLMRADYGYSRGNLLGAVSQSGGVPTGAVIESGTNANGSYVRFADGFQICGALVTVPYLANYACIGGWTFPAAFARVTSLSIATALNDVTGCTPGSAQMAASRVYGIGTSSTTLAQYRIAGQADFQPGDSVKIFATATGPWF